MNNLNEIITIATISKEFREKILTEPESALTEYKDSRTRLNLSPEDQEILLKHNAKSLEELAMYVLVNTTPPETKLPETAPKVLIASEYPLITDTISKELNYINIETHETTNQHLLNQPQKADLVLLCSIEFPLEFSLKLTPLYTQIAILTDLQQVALPNYLLRQVSIISLKERIQKIMKSITKAIRREDQDPFLKKLFEIYQQNHQVEKLTKREEEVLYLIEQPNYKIARNLNISPRTVRHHIQQINQKIGFNIREQLL